VPAPIEFEDYHLRQNAGSRGHRLILKSWTRAQFAIGWLRLHAVTLRYIGELAIII
jgi:hypothetical protein